MADASPTLLLAFYADDFTGATDALESLAKRGLKTALFLEPPTSARLAHHPGLEILGVAGLTRSLAPDAMEAVLRPAFTALRALQPRHVHYKVCSTFDSSPTVGSIGCAIEVGLEVFSRDFVPLLVAAPSLGRYCAFGNLFARYGIGSTGPIYRLDRHPSVSKHPVTPMTEADLRTHLAHQSERPMGLVDLVAIEQGVEAAEKSMRAMLKYGADIVFFDALNESHLRTIGTVLDRLPAPGRPLFSVGSSGLGAALATQFTSETVRSPATLAATPASPLLVLSGSCSPVTAGQIDAALAQGFTGVALDPATPDMPAAEAAIIAGLREGRSVVAYTARGGAGSTPAPARELGAALGRLARAVVAATNVPRLVFAGGDTSSYAARALGIESVEMIAPLAPGAPLCRAHAPGSPVDGLEINFKGGQVGAEDYFVAVARGNF